MGYLAHAKRHPPRGDEDSMKCAECKGSGETERDPSGAFAMTCPACDGRGYIVMRDERGRFAPDDYWDRKEPQP